MPDTIGPIRPTTPPERSTVTSDYVHDKDGLNISEILSNAASLGAGKLREIANSIGLVISDEASPDDIIRQIETIVSVAKRHRIISSDFRLEDLKDTLLQINAKKCRDFLVLWKEIVKHDKNLKIPEDIQKEQDPEKLDEKLGEWIEKNKESLSSLEELNLKGKNLDFLPKSIGKLTNLKYLNIEENNIRLLA